MKETPQDIEDSMTRKEFLPVLVVIVIATLLMCGIWQVAKVFYANPMAAGIVLLCFGLAWFILPQERPGATREHAPRREWQG